MNFDKAKCEHMRRIRFLVRSSLKHTSCIKEEEERKNGCVSNNSFDCSHLAGLYLRHGVPEFFVCSILFSLLLFVFFSLRMRDVRI